MIAKQSRKLADWARHGLITLMCIMPLAAQAQSGLPAELASAWAKTKLPESSLSVVVQEVGGPRLFQVSPEIPRNPASVMKLVTTYAAISRLGPNYVWNTDFMIGSDARINDQGVLSGPLYLRAGGDPVLMVQDLWRLMRDMRLRGIREISDVVIDRSIFGDVAIDPARFDGAGDRPYNASPDAFMVGFGAIRLVFMPDPARRLWKAFVDPAIPGIEIDGNVEWTDSKCPGSPAISTDSTFVDGIIRFRVSGKAAGSCGEFDIFRLGFSQQEYAARLLKSMWEEVGGKMTGQVRSGLVPAGAIPVASHQSPPLSEVIRLINKRSNNVMTRVLLLTLGAEAGRRPATVQSSVEVATGVLARQGLDMKGLVLDNGSGLSREGVVSADSMAKMLHTAWMSPVMPEYVSSLAILGMDGTARNRLRDPSTQSQAHVKTGALRDVRSIAGYVWGASGKRYIVVSMVNHERAHDARAFENALITWLTTK
ncbi:D-alanyl-D-alanine carboxypeptidase/D-alanyl-D-alanine-endopeptidase [Orrella sp. NBD-18]|uniref:D-alanyl-D-alanine carboxypeptidase/D-alanyl-D-alanine-endopeptidase n=1 Tax=Sheuella amnicola TaxID=2707330 RepID=A0A6B2QX14_9BURK|nr:D-alanyl-D-alanine carboxypeptidase/D-alanyl-D-alanine-endopeptidase [Sheuella amnicola]HBI83710.1 D-alanyl-D-alanine carboxypeptidase/D-alanyl-D-alanine-endopeptidase [Alcaligenaceae bacterium]